MIFSFCARSNRDGFFLSIGGAALGGAVILGASLVAGAVNVAEAAEGPQQTAQVVYQDPSRPKQGTGGRLPGSGAPITTEANPGGDVAGERDSERLIDAFRPKGLRTGEFILYPKIEAGGVYNSNIFAQPQRAKGDYIASVQPEVSLRSQFDTHMLNLSGSVQALKHMRFTTDDQVNGRFSSEGRYDLLRNWNMTGRVDLSADHEDRASPDAVQGKEPTRTKTFTGQVGTTYQQGDYVFSGFLESDRRTFDSVPTATGSLNNSDRDIWESRARVRAGYEILPSYLVLGEVEGNRRVYDREVDRTGFRRGSSGYRVSSGVGLEFTQVLRGDFLVGFMQQDYDDPRFRSPNGPSVKSSFTWTPGKLTVVVPSLERSVYETTLLNASSRVRTAATILVRHELARNILLTGFGGLYFDEYEGVSRNSTSYDLRFRALYAFGPELYLAGELEYRSRNSQLVNNNYDQAIIGLRVGMQF